MSDPTPPPDPRSDLDLVAAINAGDAHAYEVIYRRHRDWVVALAYRFTHDRDLALDVMQEAFLYLLRQFPGFTLTAQLKTFLYPVVRHTSLNHLQKARRFTAGAVGGAGGGEVDFDQVPDGTVSGTHRALGGGEDVAAMVAGLPVGQREVLILRFVDGLPLQEIATALGVPLGTVKSRLHLGLAALREDPRLRE